MNTAATAVYLRVSTESQRTDMQLRDLKGYCQQRKWKDVVYYSDKISGGKDTRPELDRMMKDIRAGKIERVLCWKLDRLGRSLSHLAFVLAELDRNNVALIVPGQGIDTSNDSYIGKMQRGILMVIAEFERDIIRDRVNAGLAAAKARGVQLGRPATINGRAAEIRKLKAKGLGLRAIARQLRMPPSSVHKALSMAA